MHTGDFSFLHPSGLHFEQSNSLIALGTIFNKSQYEPYLLVSFTVIDPPPKHCLDGNQTRSRVLSAFSVSVKDHGKVIRRHGFVDDYLCPYDRRPRPAIALFLSQIKSRNSPVRHMPAKY
ncbi:unnamed protein product [Clonostachys rosea]|uniref:Uncharacterized protein n=1 Tax=Bionectria ochroleuca TaxID=29856 RepID=A0ABY6UCD9_BIOOC|nr:unnamed protein product [Clonostachys rosea]